MKKFILLSSVLLLLLESCSLGFETPVAEFQTPTFAMQISEKGRVMTLTDPITGKNHLVQYSIVSLIYYI